jgi:uncharacterized protein (DUF362 family)
MDYTSEVSVAVRRTPQEALSVAFSKLTTPLPISRSFERIVIKTSIYNPSMPGNTSLGVVRFLSRMMAPAGQVIVVESDNPLRSAEAAFSECGYSVLEKDGVQLLNLSAAPQVSVKMPGNLFHERGMPAVLSGPAFLVNAATLKVDSERRSVGAGIKNLFGLVPEKDKSVYHDRLDDCLLDLVSVYRPNITVMDLTEIAAGPRSEATLLKVGGVVVGTDPFAVDAYCVSLLGIDPVEIPYLQRGHEMGMGEIVIDRIAVRGTEHQKTLITRLSSAK